MEYDEAVAAFEFGSGSRYVVAVHGFAGIPYQMRGLAQHLKSSGFHVVGPRLPGHGQTGEKLSRTRWPDWLREVQKDIELAKDQGATHIFVTGLSMGGTLALYAASQYREVTAIAPICAPVFMSQKNPQEIMEDQSIAQDPTILEDAIIQETLKRYHWIAVPAFSSLLDLLDEMKNNQLSKIRQPMLICQSRRDQIVHPGNARYILEHVQSEEKSIVWLENSGHLATMDYDKAFLYSEIAQFFAEHSS